MCVSFICKTFRSSPEIDMSVHGDHGSGAAKRRRDRRLRMHWLHEQLTLQMALAAALHHSRDVGPVSYNAPRSQKMDRAGEWGREMNYTAKTRDPPTPQPELFSLYEEEPGCARPRSVTDHAPQDRVERHIVQHRIEACPFVQILDTPVPQGGNQLAICTSLSRLSKCPRSRLHLVVHAGAGFPWCRRLNSWWKCRNSCSWLVCSSSRWLTLLQVLTIFSQDRIIGLVWEQSMDIPDPHGRGGRAGRGGLQGARPGQNSAAFCMEQNTLKFQFLKGRGGRGGGLRPDPNSAASSAHSPGASDEAYRAASHFSPGEKKSALSGSFSLAAMLIFSALSDGHGGDACCDGYSLEFLAGAATLNEMVQLVFLALVGRFAPVASENTQLFVLFEMVRVLLCANKWVSGSSSQEMEEDLFEWVEVESYEPEPPCTMINTTSHTFDPADEARRRGWCKHELESRRGCAIWRRI